MAGLVRVQGGVPQSITEPAQERNLVPPGRARATALLHHTGRHYIR